MLLHRSVFLTAFVLLISREDVSCKGALPQLRGTESEVSLLISPHETVQTESGKQISLICTVQGPCNSTPGLLWNKYGGMQGNRGVEAKRLDNRTLSFVIHHAAAEDSGIYTCVAQVEDKHLEEKVEVFVNDPFIFVDDREKVGPVPTNTKVNISCEVEPFGELDYVWKRYGHHITLSHPFVTNGKYKLYKRGAILEVNNFDPVKDSGSYKCKVADKFTGSSVVRKIALGSGWNELLSKECLKQCPAHCRRYLEDELLK